MDTKTDFFCPSVRLPNISIHLNLSSPSTLPPARPSVCLSTYLSIYISIYIYPSIYPSIHLLICLPICHNGSVYSSMNAVCSADQAIARSSSHLSFYGTRRFIGVLRSPLLDLILREKNFTVLAINGCKTEEVLN